MLKFVTFDSISSCYQFQIKTNINLSLLTPNDILLKTYVPNFSLSACRHAYLIKKHIREIFSS